MNNAPITSDGLLDTQELATRLRVTPKAVRAWVKAGCPVAKREKSAHGRQSFMFDLKSVRLWLVSTGNVSRSMLAAPEIITNAGQPTPTSANGKPIATPAASSDPVEDRSHFTKALDRARKSEEGSFMLWAQTLNSDKLAAAAFHDRYLKAADSLTRMEKVKGEILLAEASMMKTSDAYEATASILQSVKIDLESLPNAIAPRLAGLGVPEAAAVLREAIQDILRHLHGEKTT